MNEAATGLPAPLYSVKFTDVNLARFWAKVDKNGPLPDQSNPHYAGLDPCWLWMNGLNAYGYGQACFGSTITIAHRFSFFLHFGAFERRAKILHRCDVPNCVNPGHLFIGTQADNVSDMVAKGRSRIMFGEKNGRAKLSSADVEEIRIRLASRERQIPIARDFGVCVHTISRIAVGHFWKQS